MLELGKDLLDRVQIGRVGRQKQQPCPDRSDSGTDGAALVAAEIVDDDDIAPLQCRQQDALDIGSEAFPIDGSIEKPGGLDTVAAQCRKDGHGLPMTVRDLGRQALPARTPATQRGHVGLGPGLVDEDQARWINPVLVLFPAHPAARDVRAVLL